MSNTLNTAGTALIRRHIGRRFTELRKRAALTQEEAAKRIDRSLSTLIRLEDGHEGVRFREIDVKVMLDVYKADAEERELLLGLTAETRNGNRKSWWHDYTETDLPERIRLFVVMEDSAETIRQYESELIPGLLQTRHYAQQMMSTPYGYATDEEIEGRVQVRLDRQSVLTRPRAPRLEVVLNEAAIRRPMGGVRVMAEQLEYLLEVIQQGNISIRIVPFKVGVHAGAVAGTFSLLEFPKTTQGDPLEPPLVYVDTITGAMYLNKTNEVAAYRLIWQDLLEKSLDGQASEKILRNALKGLRND